MLALLSTQTLFLTAQAASQEAVCAGERHSSRVRRPGACKGPSQTSLAIEPISCLLWLVQLGCWQLVGLHLRFHSLFETVCSDNMC